MVDLLIPKQSSLYPINYDFTKLRASTGNRTRNNSLEGCYANHYTIDALGDLLIFEARNYIFKSKIQIQKELASSGIQPGPNQTVLIAYTVAETGQNTMTKATPEH